MKTENFLKEVRDQYESYPYPPRDINREKTNFLYMPLDDLNLVNFHCYGGRKDFFTNRRFLIAGGGTGDSAIMLAEQLKETNSEIVFLDFSSASIDIAKKRCEIRKIDNIKWIHDSILNIDKLELGKFDYISCCGVLHHLKSPADGLKSLTSCLKDDGVIALMLYAKYGRQRIYQMQNLLKLINDNNASTTTKIANTKKILNNLPDSNQFKHEQNSIPDIVKYGDVGIYDLLLHSNDIAYTVEDIYDFVASSNLELLHFTFDRNGEGNNLYNLDYYLKNTDISLDHLTDKQKQATAELIHGNIAKHCFYAAKQKWPKYNLSDLTNIPMFSIFITHEALEQISKLISQANIGDIINLKIYHMNISFKKNQYTNEIFKQIDGIQTINQIIDTIGKDPEIYSNFKELFEEFKASDCIFLRSNHITKPKSCQEIFGR